MTDPSTPQGQPQSWHATTILTVRKGGRVVIAGDGQVSLGATIIKANARKVRQLGKGGVIGGFAGATADAFTLFERLEGKLEQYPGQLMRAAVELAKDWRTDRFLRRLEAMMIVADRETTLVLDGHRRCAGAGAARDGHRLRRHVCAFGGARAARPAARCRGDRAQGHGHRGRHLRLHKHQHRGRKPGVAMIGDEVLDAAVAQGIIDQGQAARLRDLARTSVGAVASAKSRRPIPMTRSSG